jgi:hypothetical protein
VLLAASASQAAVTGLRDPEFARFPLDRWLTEGRQTQIHWSVIIPPADLSTHQRMILRVTARVDGRELAKRRNAGEIVGLIEYSDGDGHAWQNHIAIDPAKLRAALQREYLDITFYAFVLPGDYTISLAVCDPKTMEHSVASRKAHVAAPKNDPLPDAWAGLPAVELITGGLDPPDVWYLENVTSRLNLPLETKRPLHVQLLLNTTPSGRTEGSASAMRDNMSVLVPALKILSQMQLRNGATDVAMIDLTHRREVFEQKNVAELNWDSMRKFFADAKPGIVDIHTLADRRKTLAFFAGEIDRRLAPGKDGAAQVVIVLSGPAFFEDQEAAATPKEPLDPNSQLIYIRYRTALPQRRPLPGGRRPTAYSRFPVAPPGQPGQEILIPPMPEDDLEKTAEPLNARLFDAASATQFRRILAAVREQLSRM